MLTSHQNLVVCVLMSLVVAGCDDGSSDPVDPCDGVDCGDHGTCDPDRGSCECDEGFSGEACDEETIDCGARGVFDSESSECECDTGYGGALCDTCDDGYVLDDDACVPVECIENAQCDDGLACNGEEICSDDHQCATGEPVDCGENSICAEPGGSCGCAEGYDLVGDECLREVLGDLEDLSLDAESFWNGTDESGFFQSGGTIFHNSYNADFLSWDGFAYSNTTDTATTGYENQYSAITGGGANGSSIYAVAYESSFSLIGPPTLEFVDAGEGVAISGAYITNTAYTYISMRDGDSYCKQFGGETGEDPDWFLLSIQGVTCDAQLTDPVDFYLADFRSETSEEDYIIDEWTWVDLTSLGEIVGLQFTLSSSDVGEWGMNTPAYFSIDEIMHHGR